MSHICMPNLHLSCGKDRKIKPHLHTGMDPTPVLPPQAKLEAFLQLQEPSFNVSGFCWRKNP